MNPILKGTIAFVSITGTGGLGYGIYSLTKTNPEKVKTYAQELSETLLSTTDANYKSKWQARLDSLQKLSTDTDLVPGLKVLRVKKEVTEQWIELRTWCANSINKESKGKENQEFKNIQNYCTYSIKEKLGSNVIPDGDDPDSKWTKAHSKLSKIKNLNSALTSAKDTEVGAGKAKVKDWCNSIYSIPFKGEKDSDFELAKQVCVSE